MPIFPAVHNVKTQGAIYYNKIHNQCKPKQIKQFLTDSTLYRCCPAMSQGKKVSPAASSDIEGQDDNSLRLTKPCRDSIVYQLFGTGTHYKCNYEWGVSRGVNHIIKIMQGATFATH